MQMNSGTNLKRAWLTMLLNLTLVFSSGATASAWGEELAAAARNSEIAASPATDAPAWVELAPIQQRLPVRVWSVGPQTAGSQCYVITHGMGGTASGDRFHLLASAIHQRFPHAYVLRIDWSEYASAKFGSIPNPWKVAARIDEVGDQAALVLKTAGIDPARTTFIGENLATGSMRGSHANSVAFKESWR